MRAFRADVTPEPGRPLAGYAGPPRPSTHVAEPLEANVLVAGDGESAICLVSMDALYGGVVGNRLARVLDWPPERVIVFGSHTHFAPGVDPELTSLGGADDEYIDVVAAKIADAVRSDSLEGSLSVGYGEARVSGFFINRRLPMLGRRLSRIIRGLVRVAPNPAGDVDDVIRTIVIRSDGRTQAVLWGASCHPVCSPTPDAIGANFPGVIRQLIRDDFGRSDLPVLFLQGFSGDVRPASFTTRPARGLRSMAVYLANHGRVFAPQSTAAFAGWCAGVHAAVRSALNEAEIGDLPLDAISSRQVSDHPEGWGRPVTLTQIGLGANVHLVAVNAEVMSGRVGSLSSLGPHVIPVGCADEVIGYWPTDQMLAEGGYEACDSRRHFPDLDWASETPDALWARLLQQLSTADWRSGQLPRSPDNQR